MGDASVPHRPSPAVGFYLSEFPLLGSLLPISASTTAFQLSMRAARIGGQLEFLLLCRRAGAGASSRLLARLSVLLLCVDHRGLLVSSSSGGFLLPVESWGVAIDMAVLAILCVRREPRVALSPDFVLRELARTYVAGGRQFGAVVYRFVKDRLRGGLNRLLVRLALEYEGLPQLAKTLLEPLRMAAQWCSPSGIASFSRGDVRAIVVPGPFDLRVLEEFSDLNLVGHRALADGAIKSTYQCQRVVTATSSSPTMERCTTTVDTFKPGGGAAGAWVLVRSGAHQHGKVAGAAAAHGAPCHGAEV